MKGLIIVPLSLSIMPVILVLLPRMIPGAPTMTTVILSSWFLPVLLGYFGLFMVLILVLSRNSVQRQAKQEMEADRDALEATGNLAAAESALDRLGLGALSSEMQVATHLNSNLPGAAKATAQMESGRVMLRRAALQQTAQVLGLAPAPSAKMTLPELSPFSSSDADRR